MRRAVLPALVTVLVAASACTAVVDGSGSTASGVASGGGTGSATGSVPAPCGSSATAQAPGCLPPTPTGSVPTSSSGSGAALPSRWTPFARRIYGTPLGDPAVLNVCKVVGGVDLTRYGLKLTPPDAALAASCAADFTGAKVTGGPSVVLSVLRDGPDRSPTPTRTTVSGQSVYAYPYQTSGACKRSLVVTSGATTTVSVTIYGSLPGGRTTACGVSDALIAPFAKIAAGDEPPPTLPATFPSIFGLDACRVAAASDFASSPLARGGSARPSDYDTSCAWTGASSSLFVSAGLVRDASAPPAPPSKAMIVGTHTLYDTATTDGTCNYTWKQLNGQTFEVYYSGPGDATAEQCRQATGLLAAFLDTLGLR